MLDAKAKATVKYWGKKEEKKYSQVLYAYIK